MKQSLLILLSILSIIACDPRNDPCNATDPYPLTSFMLLDSVTKEPLIGADQVYHPDSIEFLNDISTFQINESRDSIVTLFYGPVNSGELLEFYLTSNERDTIRIEYEIRETECYDVKDLTGFFYNGALIEPNSQQLHIIEK